MTPKASKGFPPWMGDPDTEPDELKETHQAGLGQSHRTLVPSRLIYRREKWGAAGVVRPQSRSAPRGLDPHPLPGCVPSSPPLSAQDRTPWGITSRVLCVRCRAVHVAALP